MNPSMFAYEYILRAHEAMFVSQYANQRGMLRQKYVTQYSKYKWDRTPIPMPTSQSQHNVSRNGNGLLHQAPLPHLQVLATDFCDRRRAMHRSISRIAFLPSLAQSVRLWSVRP